MKSHNPTKLRSTYRLVQIFFLFSISLPEEKARISLIDDLSANRLLALFICVCVPVCNRNRNDFEALKLLRNCLDRTCCVT